MQKGLGEFTCNLYQKFEKGENVFFSGYSISSALSLAYLGARGGTKRQISQIMGYDDDASQAVQALVNFGTALNSDDEAVQTNVGNAVWIQDGLVFTQEFLTAAQEISDLVRKVDYENAPDVARETINAWVSERTNDMIANLIPEGTIDSLTRLVLTNAIYFNGKWAYQFDPELTRMGQFHNIDGSRSSIDFMHAAKTPGRYYENAGFQFVAIPYGTTDGTLVELLVIVPTEGHFNTVDEVISYSRLKSMYNKSTPHDEIALVLPKFKFRYKNDIANLLSEDMPLMFSGNADFSGITGSQDLFVSNIIHEAVIDVSEAGTEAAAATAMVLSRCCQGTPNPAVTVDRPFIFAIWDVKNKVPMFMGRTTSL